MTLLEELKRRAEIIRHAQSSADSRRAENAAVVEAAAARSFRYFFDLLKQLDVIRPVNPTRYTIPHVGALDGLALAETFIDYRKRRIDEVEYHERVFFNITWAGEPDLEVIRDMPVAIVKARDALWEHNLRFAEIESRDAASAVRRAVFTIPRRIVTEVVIRPNHDEATLDIFARNLLRLGIDDFRLPAAEVTEAALEEFAHALLGDRSGVGRYRTVLDRAQPRSRPVLVAASG